MHTNKFIPVQLANGKMTEVSPWLGSCGCGESSCFHLELAQDIYLRGGRRSLWYVLSALHKEVRRCDLERALCWAKLYCQITSPNHLLRYVEKIVLEESRDVGLLSAIKSGQVSPIHALGQLCLSPKKWTLDYLHEAKQFDCWLQSYKQFSIDPQWDSMRLEHVLLSFTSLQEGYQTLFATSKNTAMKKIFWKAVRVRLSKDPSETTEHFLGITSSGYYSRQVAIEVILGLCPTQKSRSEAFPGPTFYIPNHQAYVHDIHHSQGKALFKRLLPRIVAGEDVSEYGYDMRWSGTIFGLAWRISAFQQFGEKMFNCAWRDVMITHSIQDIIALDRFFYGSSLLPENIEAPRPSI